MTDKELNDIRWRCRRATPPPWIREGAGIIGPDDLRIYDEGGHSEEDAAFIAHARTDVPALLAEVERLRSLTPDPKELEEAVKSVVVNVLQMAVASEREACAKIADTMAQAERTLISLGANCSEYRVAWKVENVAAGIRGRGET